MKKTKLKKESKTLKLVLYFEKSNDTIFVKPTRYRDGKFCQMKNQGVVGEAVSKLKPDSYLGQAIRKQFKNCE